ncbi:cyanoglobin [Algoriphagus sp. CAU 1675]|uniref:globin domain-containing protein n=1 Tax=Algoriphagus sp. CAU 1675 TaxID=3032597 RepID=UPI0023DC56BF|nr:cyanoglobin [Algoriphagus sp. CAU 1675]MDF2159359.1 cyanoglobin [Algoriphagus sp. CAU 1675]
MNPFQSVFEAIGEEKIKELVSYFYQEVETIPELRKLYPEDLAPAERRLYLFLLQVFGGPQTYSEERGHPRLRMRHFNWEIDGKMRNHWINAMISSMDKLDLDPNVRELMLNYFIKVANHMINHE